MRAGQSLPLAPRPGNVPVELIVDWDIYDAPGAREVGPHLAWKALHNGPDIVWTPRNGGHWMVTRAADIDFLQRNHDPFSMQDVGVPHGSKPMRLLPLEADPPEHQEYRAIVSPWFTPKSIDALSGFTRELAVQLIDDLKPRGECEFYRDFALQLPIAIFCKLSNVPWTDKDMLLEWTEWTTRGQDPALRRQAHTNMIAYIEKLIADRRASPGKDILTSVVMGKIFGEPIKHEDMVSMMLVVLFGGLDTVASSMTFVAHFLATHASHAKQLIADPKLIPHAIDEMMRRFGVSSTCRTVTRDYDYKGLQFKAGDKVFVQPMLYGMDERQFDHPMDVDFSRKSVIHASFGAGPHRCPGSFLARMEIRVFLEEWLKRIPEFGLNPEAKVVYTPGMVNCITQLPLTWAVAG